MKRVVIAATMAACATGTGRQLPPESATPDVRDQRIAQLERENAELRSQLAAATPAQRPVASTGTPQSFTDENGVTVLFNDHKWFCFEMAKTGVNMCAVTPAECIEFAEATNSRPTCGVREAATCFMYERDGRKSGKCFAASTECQRFYSAFLDEGDKVTSPCMTLRYRGY